MGYKVSSVVCDLSSLTKSTLIDNVAFVLAHILITDPSLDHKINFHDHCVSIQCKS